MKSLFSRDHRTIGLLYGLTSLLFLVCGFGFMLLMRWQLAWPGRPIPLLGSLLPGTMMPGGVMLPEFYNALGAMHGTTMIFLGIVPLGVGAFGTYLVPLMIGAREMSFPRLTRLAWWLYALGGLTMLAGFAVPDGPASSGWTSYPPLSIIAGAGQTFWLAGMALLSTSSVLGALNMIVTVLQLRAPGVTLMRLPFFVWAQLVTAFLLLLAFPPLQAAAVLQLMDRLTGSSFFNPGGLVVSGVTLPGGGGGNPLLWQHLFWFLAHPEVYVLLLPAMGIVAQLLATGTGRPLHGYRAMVSALLFLGAMSLLVWAHHMFLTGMGPVMSAFFQATTLIISVPSVVIMTCFLLSLWGRPIRFDTPTIFGLAFIPMFAIGGLTGLPLGMAVSDIHLHDTYYVIGHFHYIVAPGVLLALFGGIYYWFPRVTGRRLNDALARFHLWGTILPMNGVFLPMFAMGLAGVSRRLYDGGLSYAHARETVHFNVFMTWSAFVLGACQIPFIWNLVRSWKHGEPAGENPWQADTLEWRAASPVGASEGRAPAMADAVAAPPAWSWTPRPDTGYSSVRLGLWLAVGAVVMLFGGLFSSFVLLKLGASGWPNRSLDRSLFITATSMITMMAGLLRGTSRRPPDARARRQLAGAGIAGLAFAGIVAVALWQMIADGRTPAAHNLYAIVFVIAGLLAALAVPVAGYCLRLSRRTGSVEPEDPHFRERTGQARLAGSALTLIWVVFFAGVVLW